MSAMVSEVSELKVAHLDFALFVYVSDKITRGQSYDEYHGTYAVASQIIRYFLGDTWANENVTGKEEFVNRRFRDGRAFLRSQASNTEDAFRHQDRVIKLAESLYNLQSVPGMKQRVALMQTDSLGAAFGEFQCARIMAVPSLNFRFVVANKVKGESYDGEITSDHPRTICCEMKVKEEDTALTTSAVTGSLEVARKQLPRDKPGLVWLKIPELWSDQAGAKALVDKTIGRKLKNTNRLVAVLIAWENWEAVGDGRLMQVRYSAAINKGSNMYGDDVERAVNLFGSYQNQDWLRLDEHVASRIPGMAKLIQSRISEAGDLGQPPASPDKPDLSQ